MTIDDEMLFAFIDETLDADGMQTVATAVVSDPALALRVERQLQLIRRLRSEMDRDLAVPVPDAWIAAIRALVETPIKAPVDETARLVARVRQLLRWERWQIGGTIVASLVIGTAIGASLDSAAAGSSDLIAQKNGRLVAGADLATALDTARSGRLISFKDAASVVIALSMRAGDGHYCRRAALSGRDAVTMLVCRTAEGWQIAGLWSLLDASAYGQGGDPLGVAIDRLGGAVLDAEAERAAIDNKWRAAPS